MRPNPFARPVDEQNLRILGQLVRNLREEHPLPWEAKQNQNTNFWEVVAADQYVVAKMLDVEEAQRLVSLALAGALTLVDQQAASAFVARGIS